MALGRTGSLPSPPTTTLIHSVPVPLFLFILPPFSDSSVSRSPVLPFSLFSLSPRTFKALALAAQRKTELKPLEARRTEITKQLAAQQAALTKITKEEAPLEVKVKSARAKVEESRSASRQARSTGQVLEALRRQAQRGTIAGFHGRLGDLGTIDDKYDVAVTTACGALNHLVVDTVAQAQACVNFLRTNNVGRATFIILERIQGLGARAQQPFAGPDGSLRLFDLITPKDAKFAVAFYHALQDTLVADTLDEATRIAFAVRSFFSFLFCSTALNRYCKLQIQTLPACSSHLFSADTFSLNFL